MDVGSLRDMEETCGLLRAALDDLSDCSLACTDEFNLPRASSIETQECADMDIQAEEALESYQ